MALDILVNANSAEVTTGGTTAPSVGTVETWTVTTAANFPVLTTGQQYRVIDKLDLGKTSGYEIMLVTANANGTGASWTVTRGVEGTTPYAHAANWTCVPVPTAASVNNLTTLLTITSSGTWTVPSNVTLLWVRAMGAGGGGGGGGGYLSSTVTTSGGGGGGGAALAVDGWFDVSPGDVLTITIGAGGPGGNGGNGGAGGNGGNGGTTTVTDTSSVVVLTAYGGGYGLGGTSGNSSGGYWGTGGETAGQITTETLGMGAQYQSHYAFPAPPGVVGGGAGQSTTSSTAGAQGGGAQTTLPVSIQTNGGNAASGLTGGAGSAATIPGCGGGGGGGGAVSAAGGPGGVGGAGAPGAVWIRY